MIEPETCSYCNEDILLTDKHICQECGQEISKEICQEFGGLCVNCSNANCSAFDRYG